MRVPMKCVLLLLGTFFFIISAIFYSRSSNLSREPTAGGGVEPPGDDQIPSAGEGEEETVPQVHQAEALCPLRTAVEKDPVLKERFRFSVPVLQWAKSFSKLTWKQLKNHEPPYGWKGLPARVVGSALSLLNTSRLFERGSPDRCVRCAVVGNGGILRGSRQGRDIDSHDFVFRMNGAVTRGFEEDVGTKISFYGFTTHTLKSALNWYRRDGFTEVPQSPEVNYIFVPSDLRDYVMLAAAVHGQPVVSGKDNGDRPSKYFGHKPPENFKFLHPGFISYVTNSFLSSHLMLDVRARHLYRPSTGALMLLTAIHTCDQVSAYGFITRNYQAFSDHYYDSRKKPVKFFINHDLRMELRLWETLHHQGVIRLYQKRGS